METDFTYEVRVVEEANALVNIRYIVVIFFVACRSMRLDAGTPIVFSSAVYSNFPTKKRKSGSSAVCMQRGVA